MAFARSQHAVITLRQIVALGLSPRAVQKRATNDRLHRIHHAVYSIVPRELLTRRGHWMAAVLTCGERAVLSHRTAAALHGLRDTNRSKIDVTIATRSARSHTGVELHRATSLAKSDVTTVEGIPCTTVARALLDLAAVVNRRSTERAFDQAEVMQILDAGALRRQLERNPNHRGGPIVRAILDEHHVGSTLTASELEERMLAICRRAGVARPAVNEWIDFGDGQAMIRGDFVWPDLRLIVETDGARFHSTRQARERDQRRDQRAVLAGWRPVRVSSGQVERRPEEVERLILRLVREPREPRKPRTPPPKPRTPPRKPRTPPP